MKFAFVLGGVCLVTAGAAFLLTSPPAAAANQLAGDWRCNNKINGIDSVTLVSVAHDGTTRGQLFFNSEYEGRWLTVEVSYTGRMRIEGSELSEETSSLTISDGTVDGKQLPASIKVAMRKELDTGSARYPIKEISASRLAYSDPNGATLCERSPVPLKL